MKLLGDPGLVLLIADRIYPQAGRQADPIGMVRYDVSSRDVELTTTGEVVFRTATVTYSCDAATYPLAEAIAGCVRRLIGFRGDLADGVAIKGIFDGATGDDQYEQPQHGEGLGVHTITVPLEVWYTLAEDVTAAA